MLMSVTRLSSSIRSLSQAFDVAQKTEEPDSKLPTVAEPQQQEAIQPELISSGPFTGLPILHPSSIASSMPYVFCNETGQTETLDFLAKHCKPSEKTAHIGFAFGFNFDIISMTKPSCAIICDIDKHLETVFKIFFACLNRSPSRKEFIPNLKETLTPFLKEVYGLSTDEDVFRICNVDAECAREKSWLSSDDQFITIKNLIAEGKILFQNLDMTDPFGKFGAIAEWMKKRDLKVSTLYASNILEWIKNLPEIRQEAAMRNLRLLAHEQTFFIQAYSPTALDKKVGPRQHLTVGPSSITMPVVATVKKMGGSSSRISHFSYSKQ
jgi:hypothetical protein